MNIAKALREAIETKSWYGVVEVYESMTGGTIDVPVESDPENNAQILNQIRCLLGMDVDTGDVDDEDLGTRDRAERNDPALDDGPPDEEPTKKPRRAGRKPKKKAGSARPKAVKSPPPEATEEDDGEIQTQFTISPKKDLATANRDYNRIANKITKDQLLKAKKSGTIITPFSTDKPNTKRLIKEKRERPENLTQTVECPAGHIYNPASLIGFKKGECPKCLNPQRIVPSAK